VTVVTGGAGFIGSNLVHGLNSAGMKDIVIVDSLVDARKHLNLSKAHITDYFDKDDFPDALAGLSKIDAVFHLGACAVTTEQDGRFMMKNNYTYSKTLLHACLKRKIPFIYASSAAVYGAGEHAFVENDNQEKPLNVYGFSKWAFDQHVMKILPEAQSPAIGLRYFNVYGPRESHKGDMASVIFKWLPGTEQANNCSCFAAAIPFCETLSMCAMLWTSICTFCNRENPASTTAEQERHGPFRIWVNWLRTILMAHRSR